jgi:hypothetical protein
MPDFSFDRLRRYPDVEADNLFAVDASDRLILWGDPAVGAGRQMWSWSGQDWIPLAGTGLPVSPEAEVTDTNGGHVLILGSLVQASQGAPQPIDLWSWSGSTWNQLA